MSPTPEFSRRTRAESIARFKNETFDLLVIGGGITGAAVARDAVSRGLKVALVERNDFAFGTSSRSSKLIHGGLRYLQNLELGLVFEALAERAFLLKNSPNLVRPMPFYFPVYKGDKAGRGLIAMGLWLYDILALFRTPGFHRSLSKKRLLEEIPFLKSDGLSGGFHYFDAAMWDDVLTVETLRAAQAQGAAVANYTEAVKPVWDQDQIAGFEVKDLETGESITLRAQKTISCVGPWTDQLGARLSKDWVRWLTPSKGVHLVFEHSKLPVPGAVVMTRPDDGRIAFVIPRPDYGQGVVIVGTTDGPTSLDPEKAEVTSVEVRYLMDLLARYFPGLKLKESDILSAYVGVRPLMSDAREGRTADTGANGKKGASVLQKVSREHYIAHGPGGITLIAGGKYTTHRKIAQEALDFVLKDWAGRPAGLRKSDTRTPINPEFSEKVLNEVRRELKKRDFTLPEELILRYGPHILAFLDSAKGVGSPDAPCLEERFKYSLQHEMVIHLEDFFLRRSSLYLAQKDHGMKWVPQLLDLLAAEKGMSADEKEKELVRLKEEVERRSAWRLS